MDAISGNCLIFFFDFSQKQYSIFKIIIIQSLALRSIWAPGRPAYRRYCRIYFGICLRIAMISAIEKE